MINVLQAIGPIFKHPEHKTNSAMIVQKVGASMVAQKFNLVILFNQYLNNGLQDKKKLR